MSTYQLRCTIMPDDETNVRIEVSEDLIERLEDRIPYTEFTSASEYVEFVLEEVLYTVSESGSETTSEPIDDQEVEDQLRSLGYLEE